MIFLLKTGLGIKVIIFHAFSIRHAKSVKNSTSAFFHPKNQHKKRVNPPILKFATKQRNLLLHIHIVIDLFIHIGPCFTYQLKKGNEGASCLSLSSVTIESDLLASVVKFHLYQKAVLNQHIPTQPKNQHSCDNGSRKNCAGYSSCATLVQPKNQRSCANGSRNKLRWLLKLCYFSKAKRLAQL